MIVLAIGLCAMVGCGPSKAEIEEQRRADSARIVDSMRAVDRMRIDDSLRIVERMRLAEQSRIADSIRETNTKVLESLMKKIAQTNNASAMDWRGANAVIQRYATASLKSTFAKYGHDLPDGTGCYLLMGDFSDGYTTLSGESVEDVTDDSCKLVFGLYYNGPDGEHDRYDSATFYMVREGGKWLIEDIVQDSFGSWFTEDPSSYRHMNA